jgi:hypothetical protein
MSNLFDLSVYLQLYSPLQAVLHNLRKKDLLKSVKAYLEVMATGDKQPIRSAVKRQYQPYESMPYTCHDRNENMNAREAVIKYREQMIKNSNRRVKYVNFGMYLE